MSVAFDKSNIDDIPIGRRVVIASQEPTVTVREARESKSDENQKIKNPAENLYCKITCC